MVPSVQRTIDRDERVRNTTGERRAERGGAVLAHAWSGAVPCVRGSDIVENGHAELLFVFLS